MRNLLPTRSEEKRMGVESPGGPGPADSLRVQPREAGHVCELTAPVTHLFLPLAQFLLQMSEAPLGGTDT